MGLNRKLLCSVAGYYHHKETLNYLVHYGFMHCLTQESESEFPPLHSHTTCTPELLGHLNTS